MYRITRTKTILQKNSRATTLRKKKRTCQHMSKDVKKRQLSHLHFSSVHDSYSISQCICFFHSMSSKNNNSISAKFTKLNEKKMRNPQGKCGKNEKEQKKEM